MRVVTLLTIALCALSLVAAAPVEAKGEVRATLRAPEILASASAGATVEVEWTLLHAPPEGRSTPFAMDGVFIRLYGTDGSVVERWGSFWSQPTGEYRASLVVPPGGVRGIEIGLTASGSPGGTRDLLIPITNYSEALSAAAPGQPAAAPAERRTRAAAVLLFAALPLGGAIALRRARRSGNGARAGSR